MSDDLSTVGRSVKMDAKALIEGWDMPPQARRASIARMIRTVSDPNSKPREAIAAHKALLAVDRLRMQAAAIDSPQAITTTDPEEARRALREDPGYLEYMRAKALAEDNA